MSPSSALPVLDSLMAPLRPSTPSNRRPRDTQRQKVYDAEGAAFGYAPGHSVLATPFKGYGRSNLTLPQAEAFVAKVTGSAWFERHYGPRWRIVVKDGRGHRRATSTGGRLGTIQLPTWARMDWVILHEVAHNVTTHRLGDDAAWHGWQFAGTYLALVQHYLGADAAKALKAEFRRKKVRWTEPRSRTLSPEQAEAARARLAAVRAKRDADKPVDPITVEVVLPINLAHNLGVHYSVRNATTGEVIVERWPEKRENAWHQLDTDAATVRERSAKDARLAAAAAPGDQIEVEIRARFARCYPPTRAGVTIYRYSV